MESEASTQESMEMVTSSVLGLVTRIASTLRTESSTLCWIIFGMATKKLGRKLEAAQNPWLKDIYLHDHQNHEDDEKGNNQDSPPPLLHESNTSSLSWSLLMATI